MITDRPPRWPGHPGNVPLRAFILQSGPASSLGCERDGRGLLPEATAVLETLHSLHIDTVSDLVRCEWAAVGPDKGLWHDATDAYLADLPDGDKARALGRFWGQLETLYAAALDACAGEMQVVPLLRFGEGMEDTSNLTQRLRDALAFPRDVAQCLPSPVELGRRGQVVHVAGVRGSGRKTLVLNSVVRSLWLNETEQALWLSVLWAEEEGDGDTNEAGRAVRDQIARKGTQTQAALLKQIRHASSEVPRKRKHSRDADPASTGDGTHTGSTTDVVSYLAAGNPMQRLLVDSVASLEELAGHLERIYPRAWLSGSEKASLAPATLVLDGMDRLFLDPDGQALKRFSDSALAVVVQRLLYTLVHLAKEHNTRVYLLNGAVRASGFVAVFRSPFVPALWPAVRGNVDATLWLTGETVFSQPDESQPAHMGRRGLGLSPRVVEVHPSDAERHWGVYASDGTVLYD